MATVTATLTQKTIDSLWSILSSYPGTEWPEAKRFEDQVYDVFHAELSSDLTDEQRAFLSDAANWIAGQADVIRCDARPCRGAYHDDAYDSSWSDQADDLATSILAAI